MKRVEDGDPERGPRVIWIGFQDKKEKIRRFMEMHDVRAGVGFDDGNIVAKKYGIQYGAGLVVIDGSGTVRARVPKGFSEKDLHDALAVVMRKEPASGRQS